MNAPEKIPSLRNEIARHLADVGEATAKQLAEALIQDRLSVAHTLNDMVKDAEVEREKKRGNEYVYWLSAAGAAPKKAAETKQEAPLTEAQREEFALLGVIADIRAAIGDKEGRIMLGELAEHIKGRVTQLDEQISSLTADVTQIRTALNHAINEADRLRREAVDAVAFSHKMSEEKDAILRAWREDAMDVTDAAVGYLVRAPKRKPRLVSKPERAREAALAAVRAGVGRAEVLALVPVGAARRGAEWSEIGPRPNGD